MDEQVNKLIVAFQSMNENDLTRSVIIPLLQTLGYKSVEFYGGVNEEGKDIVFWEESKFGDNKLIVAQVKHFKLTNKASDSRSLQTVINQLIMCFEKRLVFTDQKSYYPAEAFLISSYQIDVKTLHTRFSEDFNLRMRRIEIIDGNKLAHLVLQNNPQIANQLLGTQINFGSYFSSSLNNKVVLRALGCYDNIALKQIYTDIDFSLGRNTTRLFFNSNFHGFEEALDLDFKTWSNLKDIFVEVENQFGNEFISLTVDKIVQNHAEKVKKHKDWEQELEEWKKEYRIKKLEISDLNKKYNSELNNISKLLIEKNTILKIKDETLLKKEKSRLHKIEVKLSSFVNLIKPVRKEEEKLKRIEKRVNSLEQSEPEVLFSFALNGKKLSILLEEKRVLIEKKVELYNKHKPNCTELNGFIEDCKKIIDASDRVLSNKIIANNIFANEKETVTRENFNKTRFKLPIDKIFDTGHNVLLLGEAGAGKTTCLQMYAQSRINDSKRLIIWAPISQILETWKIGQSSDEEDSKELRSKKIKLFDQAIYEYLKSKEILIDQQVFKKHMEGNDTVLLLDGLDEAIKHNPWLPNAIVNLNDKYRNTQIIVTSRMSGSYIDEIPFFTVTLLPFTTKQRNQFIAKWFGAGNEIVVRKIKNHLSRNKSISEIVKNPLLTTTLCVLAKHGLPLPQTEIKLYNDRLKLLTGYYDNVKNINARITTTPQNLELLSQKLAYHLHKKSVREMNIEGLENEAVILMKNHLSEAEAKVAVNELIDPCNVLVLMTSDDKYGFGHLRYQEHLAAVELMSNRSLDIQKLLTNQWWADCLILFAQMSDSIVWLVQEIGYRVKMKELRKTLYMMMKTRPTDEKYIIKDIIVAYEEESKEFFHFDVDDDDLGLMY